MHHREGNSLCLIGVFPPYSIAFLNPHTQLVEIPPKLLPFFGVFGSVDKIHRPDGPVAEFAFNQSPKPFVRVRFSFLGRDAAVGKCQVLHSFVNLFESIRLFVEDHGMKSFEVVGVESAVEVFRNVQAERPQFRVFVLPGKGKKRFVVFHETFSDEFPVCFKFVFIPVGGEDVVELLNHFEERVGRQLLFGYPTIDGLTDLFFIHFLIPPEGVLTRFLTLGVEKAGARKGVGNYEGTNQDCGDELAERVALQSN